MWMNVDFIVILVSFHLHFKKRNPYPLLLCLFSEVKYLYQPIKIVLAETKVEVRP